MSREKLVFLIWVKFENQESVIIRIYPRALLLTFDRVFEDHHA